MYVSINRQLHRDPFTWTGTSICLEGTKIWRFVAPPGAIQPSSSSSEKHNNGHFQTDDSAVRMIDDALKSYRLPSVAWDDDVFLSSGWQSDMSLYASRDASIPSAEQLAHREEERHGPELKYDEMEMIAANLNLLAPDADFPTRCSDGGESMMLPVRIWSVVQKPGDLLVIPAFWWHQTYALEPSVAIASQRSGGGRDTKRVLSHILETVGLDHDYDDTKLPNVIREVLDDTYTGTQKEVATALFDLLSTI